MYKKESEINGLREIVLFIYSSFIYKNFCVPLSNDTKYTKDKKISLYKYYTNKNRDFNKIQK